LIPSTGGTVHKPPLLDQEGFPIYEAIIAANYLKKKGVNPKKILPEIMSLDTIGNAYFSRVIHTDPAGFRNLLIITSKFHMPRTKEAFNWVYSLDSSNEGYSLDFEDVPNEGIDEATLILRETKERESLEQLLKTKNRISTLKDLHTWLYTEHGAYAVFVEPKRGSGDILATY